MTNERITAWITKKVFTEGIVKVEGTVHTVGDKIKLAYTMHGRPCEAWREGAEWHRTYADALAAARHQRDRNLRNHRHEISRLETMDWPDTETQSVAMCPRCSVDVEERTNVQLVKKAIEPALERALRNLLRENPTLR